MTSLALGASQPGELRYIHPVSWSSQNTTVEIISLFAEYLRCQGRARASSRLRATDAMPGLLGHQFVLTPEGRTILKLWKLSKGSGGSEG